MPNDELIGNQKTIDFINQAEALGLKIVYPDDVPKQSEPIRIDIIAGGVLMTYYPPEILIDMSSEYTPVDGSTVPVRSTTFTFFDKTGYKLEAVLMRGGSNLYYRYGYQNGAMTRFASAVVVNIEIDVDIGSTVTLQVLDLGDFQTIFNQNKTINLPEAYQEVNPGLILDKDGNAFNKTNLLDLADKNLDEFQNYFDSYIKLLYTDYNSSDLNSGLDSSITYNDAVDIYNELQMAKKDLDSFYKKFDRFRSSSGSEITTFLTMLDSLKGIYDTIPNIVKAVKSNIEEYALPTPSPTAPKVLPSPTPSATPAPTPSSGQDITPKPAPLPVPKYSKIDLVDLEQAINSNPTISAADLLISMLKKVGWIYDEADIRNLIGHYMIPIKNNGLDNSVTSYSVLITSILNECSSMSKKGKVCNKYAFYTESTVNSVHFYLTVIATNSGDVLSAYPSNTKLFIFYYGALNSGRVLSFKANYAKMLTSSLTNTAENAGLIAGTSPDPDSNKEQSLEETLASQSSLDQMYNWFSTEDIWKNFFDKNEIFDEASFINAINTRSEVIARYSSLGDPELKALIKGYATALSYIAYTGEIKILGYPDLKYGDAILIAVQTLDGYLHYSSGLYRILSAHDEITGGLYSTTLSLMKQPDKIPDLEDASGSGSDSSPFDGSGDYVLMTDEELAKMWDDLLLKGPNDVQSWIDFINGNLAAEFLVWNEETGQFELNDSGYTEKIKLLMAGLDDGIGRPRGRDDSPLTDSDILDNLISVYEKAFGADSVIYQSLLAKKFSGMNFAKESYSGSIDGSTALGLPVSINPAEWQGLEGTYMAKDVFPVGQFDTGGTAPTFGIFLGQTKDPRFSVVYAPSECTWQQGPTGYFQEYTEFNIFVVPTKSLGG